MKTVKIKPGIFYLGTQNPDLRIFDVVMYTPYGTSYNSYLVQGSEKTVLFETTKTKYWAEYAAELSTITPLEEIDYLVVSHTEPDHSGCIEQLLKLNSNITIICSTPAKMFLKEIINDDFKCISVKDGEEISLGDKTLRFYLTPNLHWPDTMSTFLVEDQYLVSCDIFGAHYSYEPGLLSLMNPASLEEFKQAQQDYYQAIMSPFTTYVRSCVEKLSGLPIAMILTGHGPLIDVMVQESLDNYRKWSEHKKNDGKPYVVLPYVSAYGYTRQLAQVMSDQLTSMDIRTYIIDVVMDDISRLKHELLLADGILLGTPTMVQDALKPIYALTLDWNPSLFNTKLVSAFGSYGWSGEGVPNLINRYRQLKIPVFEEGFRCRFKPSEIQLQEATDFARRYGIALLEKSK